ncbi:tumor necrosis factor receptor superfamily member 14 [Bufo bufo]|uniref:tumor necrosis factor receptor superfamily member 14 n=1 Tax=Bufo bufo TaxID=8384 RepID=UPI001ABE26AC|nr:tumor necrosis factor receptor superfamily member 14 [Bufo bufo]
MDGREFQHYVPFRYLACDRFTVQLATGSSSKVPTGLALVAKVNCTITSNTVCKCTTGQFCLKEDCDLCHDHIRCPPGQYVKKPGTPRMDTVCEKCPPGHYSNESNSAECSPWTKCQESGRILYRKGTSTTDSECKDKRSHVPIAVAIFSLSVIVLVILLYFFFLKRNNEKNRNMVRPHSVYPFPVQEKGPEVVGSEREEGT